VGRLVRPTATVLAGAAVALVPLVAVQPTVTGPGATRPVLPDRPAAGDVATATPRVRSGRPAGAVYNPGLAGGPHPTALTVFSRNWSGYGRTQAATSSVAGAWTVPAVPASGHDAYSASWVGVDGYGNGELIQTGTGQDTANGQSLYFAWWEVLPAPETVISSIRVSPGDRMTAALAKGAAGEWTITLDDLTTGQKFSTAEPYRGAGASAEWIEEAPIIDGEQTTLADFKTVAFSGARDNGANADLLSTQAIDMIGAGGVIAHPSLPGATADDFVVSYGSRGAPVVTVPGPPTGVRAVAGRRQATLSWKAPADDGGIPVTNYTVTVSSAGRPLRQIVTRAVTSLAVTGLADGLSYTFRVAAQNAVGLGRPSGPSGAVIPSAAPGAPTGATATAMINAAVVHWVAPSSDGGAAIATYTVMVQAHGHSTRTYVVAPTTRDLVVKGLSARTAYTFAIRATNQAGPGSSALVRARTT
jgi:hypothetical protein